MAQTPEGAQKIAAARIGMPLEDMLRRLANREKWCWSCAAWRSDVSFNRDRSRGDGLAARCRACTQVKQRVSTKGRASPFAGRSHSKDARELMTAARKGKPQMRRIGARHSAETRSKISASTRENAARGPAAPGFIDGKGQERRGLRASPELKRWRYDVYLRDGFACQHCGDDRGGNLHAHHIRSFAGHPDLRFDVRNGVTLCRGCHEAVHAYGLKLWSPTQALA